MKPKISIIIPVYNHAEELPATLESVFGQTFSARSGDLEVIVVNDGSTDNVEAILAKWQKKYSNLKVINQPNRGAPAARNRGFEEARGEYVIFWDADMTAKPEMLEKELAELEKHPEASYVYSSFKFGWKNFKCGHFDPAKIKKLNFVHTSALIRREHFPYFNESLKKFQDWDLWLTMLEQGRRGRWIPETLFHVRPRRQGISSWLPSFVYRFPWLPIPALRKYTYWKKILAKRHNLN